MLSMNLLIKEDKFIHQIVNFLDRLISLLGISYSPVILFLLKIYHITCIFTRTETNLIEADSSLFTANSMIIENSG